MRELIGKVIEEINISGDKCTLQFIVSGGQAINYQAEGDSNNSVWINHVNGIEFLRDATVVDVREREWIQITDEEAKNNAITLFVDDYNEILLYTILTTKGMTDIEIRNSHNGYYGGVLLYLGEDLYLNKGEGLLPVKVGF